MGIVSVSEKNNEGCYPVGVGMIYIVLDARSVTPHPSLRFFKTVLHPYNIRYYIDTIFRFPLRRSYLFHGAIDDYTAEEIFMRHVIHKGMNIDYVAYKCKI